MKGKFIIFVLIVVLIALTMRNALLLESLTRRMTEAIWHDLAGINSLIDGRNGVETLPGLLADVSSAIRLTGLLWGSDSRAHHALCNLRWAIWRTIEDSSRFDALVVVLSCFQRSVQNRDPSFRETYEALKQAAKTNSGVKEILPPMIDW